MELSSKWMNTTMDDFRRTLPLEDGNYVVVCADKQVKVTLG